MSPIDTLVHDFLAQKRIAVVGVSDKRETGCLDGRADRVVVISVLHAIDPLMDQARIRVARGGDPAHEAQWGIQGPGLDGPQSWREDHALTSWRFLWAAEVDRRGLKPSQVPAVFERYPWLAGGRPDRLPAWLAEPRFLADLSARGIRFESLANGWGDYRSTVLVLAVRADSPAMLATKPATKVYNAWLAGVPVLATAEPAYLEVRGSPLDFMEIASPEDVLAAIDRLKASPGLYRSMIANGLAHAREFDIEAIRGRWLDLFDREILPMHARGHVRPGPARRAWYVGAMAAQKVLGRAFKARVGFERWRLFSPWTPLRLIEATGRSLAWGWKPPLPEAGNGPESNLRRAVRPAPGSRSR